jgi:hypothetical protein
VGLTNHDRRQIKIQLLLTSVTLAGLGVGVMLATDAAKANHAAMSSDAWEAKRETGQQRDLVASQPGPTETELPGPGSGDSAPTVGAGEAASNGIPQPPPAQQPQTGRNGSGPGMGAQDPAEASAPNPADADVRNRGDDAPPPTGGGGLNLTAPDESAPQDEGGPVQRSTGGLGNAPPAPPGLQPQPGQPQPGQPPMP